MPFHILGILHSELDIKTSEIAFETGSLFAEISGVERLVLGVACAFFKANTDSLP